MRMIFTCVILATAALLSTYAGAGTLKKGCTDGWRITGYDFPNEVEYDGPRDTSLIVRGEKRLFKKDFVHDTDDQYEGSIGAGWGKTLEGDAIGHYGPEGTWTSAEGALDPHENPLSTDPQANSAAVDLKVIPYGTRFTIPTLPGDWAKRIYVASDVGPAIKEKHIDIFTGAGKEAERETYVITSDNNTICIK